MATLAEIVARNAEQNKSTAGGKRHWATNFRRLPKDKRTDPETGIAFHSRAELAYFRLLRQREREGEIRDLKWQIRYPIEWPDAPGEPPRPVLLRSEGFPNGRRAVYTLDFEYVEIATGRRRFIEYKSTIDKEAAKLRRALVERIYQISIEVIGGRPKRSNRNKRKIPTPSAGSGK